MQRSKLIQYVLSLSFSLSGCGLYQNAITPSHSELIKRRIPEVERQLEEKIAAHENCSEISSLEEEIYKLKAQLPLEIKTELELKEGKYDNKHARSCGPSALEITFARFREDISARNISKEIIAKGGEYTFFRNFLRIFHADFAEITFPQEIFNTLKRHGYYTKIKRGNSIEMMAFLLDMAERKQIGIVRLRDKKKGHEHYEPFPPRTITKMEMGNLVQKPIDIPNYFESDTEIIGIYEVNPTLQKRLLLTKKRVGEKIKNLYYEVKYLYELAKSKYLLWQLEELKKNK